LKIEKICVRLMFEFCFENTTTIGGRWTKTAKLSNRTPKEQNKTTTLNQPQHS
jgi:hypothetical protein